MKPGSIPGTGAKFKNMLKDIIEIKNVFDNVNGIVTYAKNQKYYNQQEFVTETNYSIPSSRKVYPRWQGHRTELLHLINPNLFSYLCSTIISKAIKESFNIKDNTYLPDVNYVISAFFHYMTEDDVFQKSWIHRDEEMLMSGVVYLTENAPKENGTMFFDGIDGENFLSVDNEFNKLIMFNAHYPHSASNGFGKNVNDGRLTLVFFIEKIQFGKAISER